MNGVPSADARFHGMTPLTVSDSILNGMKEDTKVFGEDAQNAPSAQQKKRRRKRTKKGTAVKSKGSGIEPENTMNANAQAGNQNVLCISRNKHWKYISSYHVRPVVAAPARAPRVVAYPEPRPSDGVKRTQSPSSSPSPNLPPSSTQGRKRGFARLLERGNSTITLSSNANGSHHRSPVASPAPSCPNLPPPFVPPPGKAAPPPIDPGVFRSVTNIRRLIDEAAELSVRASSGLSAAALGSLQAGSGGGAFGLSGSPWAAAQALGLNPLGDLGGGGGRNVPISANRIHRLRALAVQKLADAYRADEIASSVMVMQRGTVFDDIAEKVLKFDPKNVDARYVHFFHEKIPSRQLAESTSTNVLDQLIAENPQRLEFYRTRGVVHCYRDEYALAVKNFSHALKEARAVRKARQTHNPGQRSNSGDGSSKARRKKNKINGQAPPEGTAAVIEGPDGEQLLIHPSVLPDAPAPIELQCLFLRASAYFSHAMYLIEEAFFKIEGIPSVPLNDFGEMQLSHICGKYGGTEVNNTDGPLGHSDGPKARAYRAVLGENPLREQICTLLKKSKRDHERFLAHFDTLEPPNEAFIGIEQPVDLLHKLERAFELLDTYRPTSRQYDPSKANAQELADIPLALTTYHPLMLESHFTILNCLLMLGEFETLTTAFERTAGIVAGLEGYPVFLPPRSMAQGEFIESLERLASGWKYGKMSNALVRVQKQPARPIRVDRSSPVPALLLSPTDDDFAVASSSSAGPSASASCSTKTSPAPGRRPSLSEDADADAASSSDSTGPSTDKDTQAQADLRTALEHLRFLLAPIHTRLRARAERERATNEKDAAKSKKSAPLCLALHSARVEVILAWLGAVHLPELEAVATSTS